MFFNQKKHNKFDTKCIRKAKRGRYNRGIELIPTREIKVQTENIIEYQE